MNQENKQKLIATPSQTSQIMKHFDLKMKKSLGQNFLVEPQILNKMLAISEITEETTVIEIGPGIGGLTEYLAQKAKQVVAFEIDQRFVQILSETLAKYDNVQVVHEDILKVDFHSTKYADLWEAEHLVVVANLPYYITTPIIMHLLASQLPFQSLVMMMQKEVAERMTAQIGTKSYSSLTVAIQRQMKSELAFIVPKSVFIPQPNVDSAVLKLSRLKDPPLPVKDELAFQELVQACFKQRRKTLWNNLKAYLPHLAATDLQKIFQHANIDEKRRAETLSQTEFVHLYQAWDRTETSRS